jgi:hypothetical protein
VLLVEFIEALLAHLERLGQQLHRGTQAGQLGAAQADPASRQLDEGVALPLGRLPLALRLGAGQLQPAGQLGALADQLTVPPFQPHPLALLDGPFAG